MRDGAHRADAAPARLIRAGIAALCLVALGGAAQIMGGGSGQTAKGPTGDRVGLPADYRTTFTHLRSAPLENGTQVLVVYANDRAASVTDRANVPYPYGSIFVAEWRHAMLDDSGTPLRDADGRVGICPLPHRRPPLDPAGALAMVRGLPSQCGGGARLRVSRALLADDSARPVPPPERTARRYRRLPGI